MREVAWLFLRLGTIAFGGPAAHIAMMHDELVRRRGWLTEQRFLKIGAVLYGGGYVLLAFLHGDFVERLHWLTDAQLTDAIAIGQVTPGPVFTTATFVGYLVAGVPGAVLATVGIFLPSFLLVGLLTKLTDKIRSKEWSSALLDGVNAAALALMAGLGAQLAHGPLVDPLTVILCAAAVLALWRTSLNTAWLILAGGVAGVLHAVLYAH
ncbi:chromate transporter [Planotetraspora sp. A-T 1434]|uniref:chromate transporter n=1 Tax=Planotetraspora sp. A-T 1434 TaxID=2979219 RepID=UPI0021BF800C|nr:chromate transporter [Planotetraspora sp. A-T 1434]MCT9928748.1 chromate transporter [Planotetraspora sp. A-T 1434]